MRRRPLLALAGATLAAPAMAQAPWPRETVRLIVPFGPGGATDIPARLFAEELSKFLPQRVVVENRSGAGVTVGAEVVARAPKDGHTLLYNTMAHAVMKAMFPRLGFDPVADFAPVALLGVIPMVLLANKNLPAKTLPELLALLRANPGKYSYGSGGNGSATHLITALLLKRAGDLRAEHVPYRGAPPAMLDLIAGRLALFLDVANTGLGYRERGDAVALAVSTANRMPQAPDIPTFAEGGVKGADSATWHMALAPAGTPQAAVEAANAAFTHVLAQPEVERRLAELAIQTRTGTSAAASTAFLAAEVAKWSGVIRDAGIAVE